MIDWGENIIETEQGIIPREWFLTSLEEEDEHELDQSIEDDWRSKVKPEGSKKMKQLELNFSKTIVSTNKEDETLEGKTEVEETIPDGRKLLQDYEEGVVGVHAQTGSSSNIVIQEDTENITKDTSENQSKMYQF